MKTEEDKTIMSDSDTEFMKSTNIAHLVGRMEAILKMIEFDVLRIKENECLVEILSKQINQAKAVNNKIFEMHKKNELDKIKKTYNDENE